MDTAALRNMTRAQVENWHQLGNVSQAQFEGYMHAWTTGGAFRFSPEPAWTDHASLLPDAQAVATELGCCQGSER